MLTTHAAVFYGDLFTVVVSRRHGQCDVAVYVMTPMLRGNWLRLVYDGWRQDYDCIVQGLQCPGGVCDALLPC